MCGIAGIVEQRGAPLDAALLRRMTTAQAHRGPDGEGFVHRRSAGLGHRRLAIIDLATGDQPMANEDGTVWLAFNGEIYNFRELRQELESRGARFRTTSDTEVILKAYEADGPACVTKLRGMFAFAILDERRRQLFLARDRVGIKPLVYARDGERLLFASELKAILEDPRVSRDLDLEAFGDYLTYHYVPAPKTIFRSIRKLPPASTLLLPLDGGEPVISSYWSLNFESDQTVGEAEWIERLRHELSDAVRSHMVSDVPIGAFLSGGVDSSSVVATMAQISPKPIRTFSIGFDERDFDELAFAREVAKRYGTEHYEMVVKPDALDVLPKLVWQFDEPFADSSAVPTYYVSKIAREHVTVALSGDGGDENFAGYRRYAEAVGLSDRLDHGVMALSRPLFRLLSRLLPVGVPGQAYSGLLGATPLDRYFRMVTFQRKETLRRLLSDDLRPLAESAADSATFDRLAGRSGARDYVTTMQAIDIHTYLPEDILTKVDKASMLVSLETRVPLLDHRFMEFVATIPASLKLSRGAGKSILKTAMTGSLPAELLYRRKMGFGVPLASWFRRELADMTRDLLTSPRASARGLFKPRAVEQLITAHLSGDRDHSSQLWALTCFELWNRQWVDRPAS